MTDQEKDNTETAGRTYESYRDEYTRIDGTANWAKGDLLAEMITQYGDATMARLAEDTDTPATTLYAYAQVARAYPENSRRLEIPWTVYHVFVSDPERLDIIVGWKGTVREARELARGRKAKAIEGRITAGDKEQEDSSEDKDNGPEIIPAAFVPVDLTVFVKESTLLRALQGAVLFASKEGERQSRDLRGVHLRAAGGMLTVEATDHAVIIQQDIPCEGDADIFVRTGDIVKMIRAMKFIQGFAIGEERVMFAGQQEPDGSRPVTVSMPWVKPSFPWSVIAGVFARNEGGDDVIVGTDNLERMAQAARIAGEERIVLRWAGRGQAGKPERAILAEAGPLRMALQPRRAERTETAPDEDDSEDDESGEEINRPQGARASRIPMIR